LAFNHIDIANNLVSRGTVDFSVCERCVCQSGHSNNLTGKFQLILLAQREA